jgi:trk system potassium uptake protein TrkH
MNPPPEESVPEPVRAERLARRIRTAEWVLMSLALTALLLGHGVRQFETAVGNEVGVLVTVALALLVVGYAVRFYLNPEKRDFLRQRWFQIGVQILWIVGLPVAILADDPSSAVLTWSQGMFLARVVASLAWLARRLTRERSNPAFVFVGSFASLVLGGTLLLMLPVCRIQPPEAVAEVRAPVLVALFTATSASCVTGLTVVDTGTYWSRTGQAVILGLIQFGGLGVMTFGAFFALGQRRGFLVRESVFLGKLLEADDVAAVRRLVRSILVFTIASELLGAVVLSTLAPPGHWSERAWFGLFHSVSAFCNAGFGLLPRSLEGLGNRWQVWGGVASLIIVGGLGFDVLRNAGFVARQWLGDLVPAIRRRRATAGAAPPRLSLTSRLVLVTTALLLVAGLIAFWLLETGNIPAEKTYGEQIADAWFQSVTCRTAGFNTVDFAALRPATKLAAIALMFIGASPGSTGGGVKTVVFALTVLATASLVRGHERLDVAGRTIAPGSVQRAVAVLLLGLVAVLTSTLLVAIIENQPERFLDHAFETTSAFATVGLSTGVTPGLHPASQLVLVATMFVGRVGPLTVLLALSRQKAPPHFEYPSERVHLG